MSLLNQHVEYYDITIGFASEVTLWCCPGPAKEKCSGTVKAAAQVMELFSLSTVKLLDHEVSRYHKISEQLVEEGGEKLPLELSAECGKHTKKKVKWKYDIRVERRLTPEEYEKEKIQKDEVKVKNMMKELDFCVDFTFELSCQDEWKLSRIRVFINPNSRQWAAKLDKPTELKTECPRPEGKKEPPRESPTIIPKYYPPSECTVPLSINVQDGATMQPLVGLPLELHQADGTVVESFHTGADGKAIVYLPEGSYLVRASIPLFGFGIPAYASPMIPLAPDRPYHLNIILYTLIPVKYVPTAIYALCAVIGILIAYRLVRLIV